MNKYKIFFVLLLSIFIVSCGRMGPLYLPDVNPPPPIKPYTEIKVDEKKIDEMAKAASENE